MGLAEQLAMASVKHLLEIEDQRTRQLKAIHRTVQAHLEQAYNAGRVHLAMACDGAVDDDSRARHLRLAEERFVEAVGAFEPTEPLQCAWACSHLVGICHVDGRHGESASWMARAHAQAVRAVREECARANDRIEGRVSSRLRLAGEGTQKAQLAAVAGGSAAVTAGGLVLGAIMLPAVVAGGVGVAGYRRHQARRSAVRLQELTAFVSEIEAAARELGTAALPRHELRMDETDAGIPRYGYVPVDVSPGT